jgi:hypothetical protein
VPSFDITSILDFNPPRFACPVCRGLTQGGPKQEFAGFLGAKQDRTYCPVCKVDFIKGELAPKGKGAVDWFREQGSAISLGSELFEHARMLAKLVKDSRGDPWRTPWPTMRLLFEVLSRARSFVHFASWGISHQFVGVLKLTSMRVPVYGFVTSADREITRELTEFPKETPHLNAQVISPRTGNFEAPHQKLVIVDGLLAFKGSTNLTNAAIRKADTGLDISEVVTDYQAVADLNNRFFAPVWKKTTAGDTTEMIMWDYDEF